MKSIMKSTMKLLFFLILTSLASSQYLFNGNAGLGYYSPPSGLRASNGWDSLLGKESYQQKEHNSWRGNEAGTTFQALPKYSLAREDCSNSLFCQPAKPYSCTFNSRGVCV